jgi:hypothetical protein
VTKDQVVGTLVVSRTDNYDMFYLVFELVLFIHRYKLVTLQTKFHSNSSIEKFIIYSSLKVAFANPARRTRITQ